MRHGKRRGIREIGISTGVTVCLVAILAVIQHFIWQAGATRGLLSLARVVGSNSTAALAFGNAADAAEILAACQSAPAVTRARLVLPGGQVIAEYSAVHGAPRLLGLPMPEIAATESIQLNDRVVGRIEMTASLEPVFRQTLYFLGSGFAVVSIGAILGAFFSARLRRSVVVAEERMAYLALYDTLTGLPNRNSFRNSLEAAVARLGRDGRTFAVLFVDCDGFKQVNDSYGHAIGDRVLAELAGRLMASLRANDSVSRISGDEFVVLLDQPEGPAAVARIAEKLVQLMRQPVQLGDHSAAVGASVGIAMAPGDGTTAADLLHNADAAMYYAKEQGKNGFQFFSREIEARTRERMGIELELREACTRGEFHLAYQPIVSLADGGIVALEALLRWQHPARGAVSPALFIPVAEESGVIGDLGLHVLRLVAADLAWWQARGVAVPPIAVNVSFRQFFRTDGETRFLAELDDLGLIPGMVEFELTESASADDAKSGKHLIATLQEAGYRLAIDDFGTGYSSMGALREMKNPKLKIDKSLVSGIAEGGEARVIIAGILGMSQALAIPVVAEGVETAAELAVLAAMRCDYVQGFHLARPQRPADLLGILAAGRIPHAVS